MSLSINPYKTRLNHGNAYWMARLSKVVYKEKENSSPDESKILELLKEEDPGFINIYPVSEGNAQAIFVEHRQYFCMAFRGTDELMDWRDNLTTTKADFFDLSDVFHKGFYQHFEKIWQRLEDIHKDRREENPLPLFFTGHSLGGALATIATAHWVLNGDRQFTSTYTFGQPRAVTPKLARTLAPMCGSRFFRFHNNNDFVTRIPPRAMGFSHMGQIAYIDTDKGIYLDSGFWFRFQDQYRGVWDAFKNKESGIDFLADHNIDDYLFAIKNWDMRD